MATVTYFLPKGAELTPEQREEILALKNRPIVPDEDCPAMTETELTVMRQLMKKYKTRRLTKEIFEREGLIKYDLKKVAN
ncbi:MAG: hypothetical protein IJS81_02540 [Selenomonadaceae bacterium]|nr:hypothetical protein [Selenomonadaceae bacterium]MBQ7629077.1 hypothetical protein [Selenomonadaceae bacterium]